ncbi:MAG: hypothetical protein HND47_12360 [Chloroflexi bacterium]|nr:hypothetical protein [Chloroflexota bacterium]
MNKDQVRDALEKIARRHIAENMDLWPGIESRLKKRYALTVKPRFKLSSSLALALVTLLLASTAAYAYYRFLGSDAGLEGANQQDLITGMDVTTLPTVYSTPPLATPIARWYEESSAPPATAIAEEAMQNVKVILNWAYADESRVAVRFTISGLNLPEGLDYGYGAMGTFSLRDLNGNVLGQDGFSTAAENREDGSKVITANYYGRINADLTPVLALQMDIRVGGFDAPYLDPNSKSTTPEMRNIPLMGSTQFVFDVPVQKGIEVEVNQTVEANSVSMTLKHMTVNRSHTELVMCFDTPTMQDWQLWKASLRIGDSPEYPYSQAANAITGGVQGRGDLHDRERCAELGFDAPHDGKETVIEVFVPYLITPVPEVISQERVARANAELESLGIAFEYLPEKRDVVAVKRPAGSEDWEVYPVIWEALSDRFSGPWIFRVIVKP